MKLPAQKVEITDEVLSDMLQWKALYDEEVQRIVNVLNYWSLMNA